MKASDSSAGAAAPKRSLRAVAWEWSKSVLIGLLLFLTIRTFVIQTYTIISGSMENTFLVGDFIVVSKVAYGASLPLSDARLPGYAAVKRGDIVVFHSNHDDPPEVLVKRAVGLPGDTLLMRGGELIVNGTTVEEPYVQHVDPDYSPSGENWGPVVVPAGAYFMLGDNRDRSYDSRGWGFVLEDEIVGRAELIYYSWEKGAGARWSRIGDRAR